MTHHIQPATHGEFRNGLNEREMHFLSQRATSPAIANRDQADARRLANYTATQRDLSRLIQRLGGTPS